MPINSKHVFYQQFSQRSSSAAARKQSYRIHFSIYLEIKPKILINPMNKILKRVQLFPLSVPLWRKMERGLWKIYGFTSHIRNISLSLHDVMFRIKNGFEIERKYHKEKFWNGKGQRALCYIRDTREQASNHLPPIKQYVYCSFIIIAYAFREADSPHFIRYFIYEI